MPTGRGGVRNSHFRLHNTLGIRVTTFSEQNVGVKTNNLSGLPVRITVSVNCQAVDISEDCQYRFICEQVMKQGEVRG